jgi:hypothetical protein
MWWMVHARGNVLWFCIRSDVFASSAFIACLKVKVCVRRRDAANRGYQDPGGVVAFTVLVSWMLAVFFDHASVQHGISQVFLVFSQNPGAGWRKVVGGYMLWQFSLLPGGDMLDVLLTSQPHLCRLRA